MLSWFQDLLCFLGIFWSSRNFRVFRFGHGRDLPVFRRVLLLFMLQRLYRGARRWGNVDLVWHLLSRSLRVGEGCSGLKGVGVWSLESELRTAGA